MERLTSSDQLVDGATYELSTGYLVVAERPVNGGPWLVSSPQERRVYSIDAGGALRLRWYEDAAGDRYWVLGDDEQGGPTRFTVQDLRPVA